MAFNIPQGMHETGQLSESQLAAAAEQNGGLGDPSLHIAVKDARGNTLVFSMSVGNGNNSTLEYIVDQAGGKHQGQGNHIQYITGYDIYSKAITQDYYQLTVNTKTLLNAIKNGTANNITDVNGHSHNLMIASENGHPLVEVISWDANNLNNFTQKIGATSAPAATSQQNPAAAPPTASAPAVGKAAPAKPAAEKSAAHAPAHGASGDTGVGRTPQPSHAKPTDAQLQTAQGDLNRRVNDLLNGMTGPQGEAFYNSLAKGGHSVQIINPELRTALHLDDADGGKAWRQNLSTAAGKEAFVKAVGPIIRAYDIDDKGVYHGPVFSVGNQAALDRKINDAKIMAFKLDVFDETGHLKLKPYDMTKTPVTAFVYAGTSAPVAQRMVDHGATRLAPKVVGNGEASGKVVPSTGQQPPAPIVRENPDAAAAPKEKLQVVIKQNGVLDTDGPVHAVINVPGAAPIAQPAAKPLTP